MRYIPTILLSLLAILLTVASCFLVIDGNLARITGWYRFEKGGQLFEGQSNEVIQRVDWMRIQDLHNTIECEKHEDGTWWIISPYKDRMSPMAAYAILKFTEQTRLVDTLPLNNTTQRSLREFGVETRPYTLTLKKPREHGKTTVARYTIGAQAPWFADALDGKQVLPTCYLRTDFYGRDERIHVVSGSILPLFKNGLHDLRDLSPLQINPDSIVSLQIENQQDTDEALKLHRASAETDWNISSPVSTATNQDLVNKFVSNLCSLKASSLKDKEDAEALEGEPQTKITLSDIEGNQLTLSLYPVSYDEKQDADIQRATVSDRDVVFTLPAAPRVKRKGDYAPIINAIYKLPVLPEAALAKIRSGNTPVYSQDLCVTLDSLRSKQFSSFDKTDIVRVALRSRYSDKGLRLLLIPGDTSSQVKDQWMYALGAAPFKEAENAMANHLLDSLRNIPMEGIVKDIKLTDNSYTILQEYGLDQPDYVLSVLPRPCPLRCYLFGQELSLIKDRPSTTYYFKRYRDPELQESYWIGHEVGSSSICRLSAKLTRNFSLLDTTWKERQIMRFAQSSLRKLTLDFQAAPLVLNYDYIGESWTGTLKGEDVTPNINPYRAQTYIRNLQKLRVHQWLSSDDEEAIAALKNPVFTVKLELEISKVSDAEALVITQKDDQADSLIDGENRTERVDRLLTEAEDEYDQAMRDTAFTEYETETQHITLEIAPVQAREDTMFYGRILETGELFILPQVEALSLASSVIDL